MESKAERTRKYIIEKTAPVFNARGYAGTSLSDMLDVTGLTKGSIYGNFANKDEVALAAFDYNYQCVVHFIRTKMETRNTVIGKLLVYPEVYRDFLRIPFLSAGCPVLNTAAEADDTHPLLREKANQAITYWKKSVERQLKEGIRTKEIKAGTDAREFTSVLVSLIEGGIMQAKVSGEQQALRHTMDHLEKMIRALKR